MTSTIGLLQIIFQSGDFYNQPQPQSWIAKYGLIAALTSILLFYLKVWNDANQIKKQKEKKASDSLSYFAVLLQKVISFVEKQGKSYSDHAHKIKEAPLGRHMLQTFVSGDLNRILNKIDQKEIFHAYLSRFGNEKSRIQRFQNVFGTLDLIYAIFEQANTSQMNHMTELKKRLAEYKNISEEIIMSRVMVLCYSKEQNHSNENPFYKLLHKSMSDFRINAPNPTTIEFLQKEFIEKLSHELATNFSGNDDAVFLMENCRKATWLYYDSINRATISVDEYLAHANDFLTCCETLKKETADLIP